MSTTHGEIKQVDGKRVASPEYRSWQMMKNRCLNPAARDYAHYGGRGIKICRAWERSFEAFLADMGRRPCVTDTLERLNTARGYTPKNCVWASRLTQARNRPYATTKAWLLAEQLGVTIGTARHMIMQVRAKDRGNIKWFALSFERETITRNFIESTK